VIYINKRYITNFVGAVVNLNLYKGEVLFMEITIRSGANDWEFWVAVISVFISLTTIIFAYFEYYKQGKQKRAELLEHYRKKFQTEEYCVLINPLIEDDSIKLLDIRQMDKYYYLGLFEELAVLINSKVMRVDTVYYFFGYYAMKTWNSKSFWGSINRDSIYWIEFSNFVQLMEKSQQNVLNKNVFLRGTIKWKKIQV
jgi:hypothetical protein